MIVASRKELNEAIKWSKKNSPEAYLVLSMNGKWGVPGENPENIVSSFKKLWPDLRSFLSTQAIMNYADGGRIRPSELDFNYPQQHIKAQIQRDFFDLITLITEHLDAVEDYSFMESYCREMDRLFIWDGGSSQIWKGTEIYAIDKQGRYEDAYKTYKRTAGPSEKTATMYAQALLDRVDLDRAEEVLGPYRGSLDKDVQARIQLLDRLKAVKSNHAGNIT